MDITAKSHQLALRLVLCAVVLTGCEPIERHSETCKILSIDKQVETSGSGDTFSTDIYWLVVTDNGSYHIRTDGLWACPDAVGAIQKDSVYSLTVDGWFSSSFLGVYPYIVGVSPCMEKYDEKKGESR